MFLVLVFDKDSDYSEAKNSLGAATVVTVNETTFLIPEKSEEKDLRSAIGITIPKEFVDHARLVVIPHEPVMDSIGLRYSIFVDKDCNPYPIKCGSDDWIKNYILIQPDTDFFDLQIIAVKTDSKINKMMTRRHYLFECEVEDCQFFITGSKKEEKCFDIDCFDKEIVKLFKNHKKSKS